MEEKEIVKEIKRIQKKYPKRNPFGDMLVMYVINENHFNDAECVKLFDHIADQYNTTDIIEFSKIGRVIKSKKENTKAYLLHINKILNLNNEKFIEKNFS